MNRTLLRSIATTVIIGVSVAIVFIVFVPGNLVATVLAFSAYIFVGVICDILIFVYRSRKLSKANQIQ